VVYPASVASANITLTGGSDLSPKTNQVYFYLNGNTPTLAVSTTGEPSVSHIDVATFIVGAVAGANYTIYGYNRDRNEVDSFVKRSIERTEYAGTLYKSGLLPTANITALSIDLGGKWFNGIFEMTSANNVTVAGGYYFVDSTGQYVQSTSLADLHHYANGVILSSSERQNIVWGIVPTTTTASGTVPSTVRLVAVLQSEPTATYGSDSAARQDAYDATNYYPPDADLKKVFVPVARTIVKPNDAQFRTFDTGLYLKDIRGKITSGGGAATGTDVSGYLLLDGTRAMTGNLNMGTYGNITMSAGMTVDGVDISTLSAATGNVTTNGGTANVMPKFDSLTRIVNSTMTDNGTWVYTSGNLQAVQLNLTQAAGTAPISVASTTNVTNLNSDYLDGFHSTSFATTTSANVTGAGTAGYVTQWSTTGILTNGTNTNSDVASAVSLKHTQGTDTTLGTLTANISMGTYHINGLGNPDVAQDAATKDYVDTKVAAVSGNVTTIDGAATYIPIFSTSTNINKSIMTGNTTDIVVNGGITATNAHFNGNIDLTGTVDGYDVSTLGTESHTSGDDTALGVVGTKNPPIDADKAIYRDSTAGDALVTSTWAQVKAFLKTYFDTLYGTGTGNVTAQGNTGYIPQFSSATNITNSIMSGNSTYIVISGGIAPTGNITMAAGALVDGVDVSALSASSGNVTTSGMTTTYIPVANSATDLANSIVTANASYINVTGGITVTGTVDGYDVSTLGTESHTSGDDTALGVVGTKNPPVDNDKSLYRDSTAGDALVTSTWAQVKAFLKTYFDGLYTALGTSSGNVTAQGNVGYIPQFSTSTNITNSIMSGNSTDIVVNGGVTATNAHFNGNIDLIGTVDGKDVSTLGTGNVTGAGTLGYVTAWSATGEITNGTNTNSDVASAVSLKHTQGTDTALGVQATTTNVTNLNADLLDGQHSSAFALTGSTGSGNVTAQGNTNYITKFSSSTNITNSALFDNGTIYSAENIVLASGKNLDIRKVLGADSSWSGLTTTMTAGENLVIGNVVYRNADGKMYKADASDIAKVPVLAMATGSISQDATGTFLLYGFIRYDTWTWTEHGVRLYVSSTSVGTMTETAPTSANRQIQEVAIVTDSVVGGGTTDTIFFNPSLLTFMDTPANGVLNAAPTANWAYDHENLLTAHGATGAVVGTTNTQTLTNKILTSANISGGNIIANVAVDPGITIDGVDISTLSASGNVTTNGGTANVMPKFDSLTRVVNSTITDNGTWVVTTGYFGAVKLNLTQADGTAPISVASLTNVTNLNSDYVDGQHLDQSVLTTSSPTFVRVTSSQTTGTSPLSVTSTTNNTNLNADYMDGYHATSFIPVSITFVIDGGGSAITTGIKGDIEIPFACTIDRATALADTTGTIAVAIWKDTYANYPPVALDNITAGAPVSITAGNAKSQDTTLTGWTKTITAGDTLRYNVDSCSNITRVTISLRANRQ
jgi:hypothetical protein